MCIAVLVACADAGFLFGKSGGGGGGTFKTIFLQKIDGTLET